MTIYIKPGVTVSPTPAVPEIKPSTDSSSVKPATPDLIQFDDSLLPVDFITDLLFENIGGQEILSITRNDIVGGVQVSYSPIKNLTKLGVSYSPQNIFSITDTASSYFNNYAINLQDKVPEIGVDETLFQVGSVVYIDEITGDIVVNVVNMKSSERVEISIINSLVDVNDIMF